MLKTMDETACEDLKAFERRFTEIVDSMQPSAGRWRILLVVSSVCTAVGAYQWLSDPITLDVGFCESLKNHLFFTLSLFLLLLLFLGCGIHKRVVAPSIIASRCRYVLTDFNLSCDDYVGATISVGCIISSDIFSSFLRSIINCHIDIFCALFGSGFRNSGNRRKYSL